MKLKYNDTGKEKECLPQVGQWNMMNKVLFQLNSFTVVNCIISSCSVAPIRIKLHSDKCSDTQGSGVVASQDWPEVTKYAGLVCAQAHRQELIQDLFKTWHDPQRGTVTGGMIRFASLSFKSNISQSPTPKFVRRVSLHVSFIFFCRELLISFRKATGQKPLRIIFYR
ncbi:hypothetical protein BHM03_00024662 [Ensete ventricosum]|nr:hypothetical protein BHM03_00024662 [Ensete ventricosum]